MNKTTNLCKNGLNIVKLPNNEVALGKMEKSYYREIC